MAGCEEHFRNTKELPNATYNCRNEPDPYRNNYKNNDIIGRRTYHGTGLPIMDIYIQQYNTI